MSQRHMNILKDPFRGRQISKYTLKEIFRQLECEFDQTAPKGAAYSIDSLQKWAPHAADLPYGCPRRNEFDAIECFRNYYVNEDISYGVHKELSSEASATPLEQAVLDTISNEHHIPPSESLRLETLYSKTSATNAPPTTLPLSDAAEVSTSNDDIGFAPSWERTSSNGDGAAPAHAFPNKGAIYFY